MSRKIGHRKWEAIEQAKIAYLKHPDGLTDAELAVILEVSPATAFRYRRYLAHYPVAIGRYRYIPSEVDVEIAKLTLQSVKTKVE